MAICFELNADQLLQLRDKAVQLGVSPEELARAAVADLLTAPDAEFERAMQFVLNKNGEFYQRLAR